MLPRGGERNVCSFPLWQWGRMDSVPALLIKMSTVPKASTVALTHRAGKSSAVTSPAREMASPPCERISAATCHTVWKCEQVSGWQPPLNLFVTSHQVKVGRVGT